MHTPPPLILVTNDDGIDSPGLRAAVHAVLPLGEVIVAAPDRQWSGAARSLSTRSVPAELRGRITPFPLEVDGRPITAYQIAASPALAVIHALLELVPRPPALLISGINYGENLGSDITSSGTVGAALQAAACAVPALATSLQTPKETHYAPPSGTTDFAAAVHFTRLFAHHMLQAPLPADVDLLKLDVPAGATLKTPWRLTRVSRHPYFVAVPPERASLTDPLRLDYEALPNPERTEPDSDIYALAVDRVVSLSPMSLDLTTRASFDEIKALLH